MKEIGVTKKPMVDLALSILFQRPVISLPNGLKRSSVKKKYNCVQ